MGRLLINVRNWEGEPEMAWKKKKTHLSGCKRSQGTEQSPVKAGAMGRCALTEGFLTTTGLMVSLTEWSPVE